MKKKTKVFPIYRKYYLQNYLIHEPLEVKEKWLLLEFKLEEPKATVIYSETFYEAEKGFWSSKIRPVFLVVAIKDIGNFPHAVLHQDLKVIGNIYENKELLI